MGSQLARVIAAAALIMAVLPPGPAWANRAPTTFKVNSLKDSHDIQPGDGRCADSLGRCTARAAVEEADAQPAGSSLVIRLPAGIIRLVLGTLQVGRQDQGTLSVSLMGHSPSMTQLVGNGGFRLITVGQATTVAIDGVELTGGDAGPDGYGGAVYNKGNLTVANSRITHNQADAGGGLDNAGGSLTVTDSEIDHNDGGMFGGGGVQNGGPDNLDGSVRVVSSVIAHNVTSNNGGGLLSGQNGHAFLAPVRLRGGRRSGTRSMRGASNHQLTIVGSLIEDNLAFNGGGGVAALEGTLAISASTIDGNSAHDAIGGGIFTLADLDLRGSVVSTNDAVFGGGLEEYAVSTTTVATTTFRRNTARAYGGAIDANGEITMDRSLLMSNHAGGNGFEGGGGAVQVEGGAEITIADSTIAGNSQTQEDGGALQNFGGELTLSYDTVAGNGVALAMGGSSTVTATIITGRGPNCLGQPPTETAGYNLENGASCRFGRATDVVRTEPLLGPLADNGGPTPTRALLPGSPAINAGGTPGSSGCPLVDQRGVPRPQGPACDIGAFELQQ